jgi:hypothetical protein
LANRIAIKLEEPPPTLSDLRLERAKELAFEWQQRRSHARFNDMHGYLSVRPGARWINEVHGIIGVVGEQILVAIEAEAEKFICSRALGRLHGASESEHASSVGKNPTGRAHYSRSLRFFSEGQANALVVACHALTNLVLRSLEFDRPLSAEELRPLRISESTFQPWSDAASAWVSMNERTLRTLTVAAQSRNTASQSLVAALRALHDEDGVRESIALRNVQYHRWRGETAGVTGLSRKARSAGEILAAGQAFTVSSGPLLPEYVEGTDNLEELVNASRGALDGISRHLDQVHAAWYQAFVQAFSPWLDRTEE